jgi:AcrR family transcriptional regulator
MTTPATSVLPMLQQTYEPFDADDDSVRARLVRAADEEMTQQGTASVTMAAVAERAGVSRATAFRQLGGTSEMIIQVGLHRSRQHIARVQEIMDSQADVFSKMEDAMVYTTRELPGDPVIEALMAQRTTAVRDQDIHSVTSAINGPVLRAGQAEGLIRTDIPVPEIIDFLIEQTYLAAEYPDRSEAAARHRFRTFVAPALRPQPHPATPPDGELEIALSAASDAIAAASAAAARMRG